MDQFVIPGEYEDFQNGDRVYHRGRRAWGDFGEVDPAEPETTEETRLVASDCAAAAADLDIGARRRQRERCGAGTCRRRRGAHRRPGPAWRR